MFQTMKNAWKIAELRNKLLFTLLIIILYKKSAINFSHKQHKKEHSKCYHHHLSVLCQFFQCNILTTRLKDNCRKENI